MTINTVAEGHVATYQNQRAAGSKNIMNQLGLEPRSPTSSPSARHAGHIGLSSRHLSIRPPGHVVERLC